MKTGLASQTAIVIPKALLYLASQDGRNSLVSVEDQRAYRELLEAAGEQRLLRQLKSPIRRWLAGWQERLTVPGIFTHFALRKNRIASLALGLLPELDQVVILGAGLDVLSAKLKRTRPALRVYEVDRPETQAIKRAAGYEDGVHLEAADLAEEALPVVLARCPGFVAHAPTLFVVEGLSMYLDEETNRTLLQTLASGPHHLIFTFMEAHAGGLHFRNATPLLAAWLALKGEPFVWGCTEDDISALLSTAGWDLIELHRTSSGTEAPGIAQGELIAFARTTGVS